jgi:hypothetical protein
VITRRRARGSAALVAAGAVLLGLTACVPARSSAPSPVLTASAAPGACGGATDPLTKPTVRFATLPDAPSFTARVAEGAGRIVSLGATTVPFTDFGTPGSATDAALVGPAATGLVGAGVGRTVLEMVPHTSTHAADIPTEHLQPNQLALLRVVGDGAVLRNFTLQGTDQGHLYNGLKVARVVGLHASYLRVVGIPGDNSSPPGETMSINDFKTVDSRWSHIEVDGAGLSASGFGVNGSRGIEICDTDSHDNAASMGFAFWQSRDARLVDCVATDNGYSGFNFERQSGTNTLVRPVATGNRFAMRIASDQGSAKFTIIDPQLVGGHWTVTMPKRWYGSPNLQKRSDITLIVHGKRRPDLLRFQTY